MSVTKKQKLELTWIVKENRPRLEPRILLEAPETSYHAAQRVTEWSQECSKNSDFLRSLRSFAAKNPEEVDDLFDNRLNHGDNLLALKALAQEFSGAIYEFHHHSPPSRPRNSRLGLSQRLQIIAV